MCRLYTGGVVCTALVCSFARSRVPRNSCNSIFRNWTDFLGRYAPHSLVPCDAIKIVIDVIRFVHEFPPRLFISYEIKRVLCIEEFIPSEGTKSCSNRVVYLCHQRYVGRMILPIYNANSSSPFFDTFVSSSFISYDDSLK